MNLKKPSSFSGKFLNKRFFPIFLLLLLAIVMIIWGIARGENMQTQRNAHYLCLDCLGIS